MSTRTSTPRRSIRPTSLVAILAVAALVAACAGAVGSAGPVPTPIQSPAAPSGLPATSEPTPPAPSATASESPAAATPFATPVTTPAPSAPAATTTVRVYFLLDDGGGDPRLVPVLRSVPATKAVATAAVTALLAGPLPGERGLLTTVPAGTALLGITIGGTTATVDLTGTFGSGGGSASMLGRLAQLVYTVTQFSTVDTVQLRLDGQPVATIGGEGVLVGQGLQRSDFRDQLPPIFVERPTWKGAFPNHGRVTGVANVFEAQFRLQLLDSRGRVLVDAPVMATAGSGTWGTFDVTIDYTVTTAQWGTLRVFDLSAKDGTVIDVREEPVYLTP